MKKYFIGKALALLIVLWWSSGAMAGSMGTALALAGYRDAECRMIPNRVCVLVMLLGVCEIGFGPFEMVKWRVISIGVAIIMLFSVKTALKNNIGMGDIKLLMACSFCMNISSLLTGMAVACFFAGATGILITRSLKKEMPLAPFIAVAMSVIKMAETF
ncbi:MAG: prepilin peptidase [Ruminococcaceae bacterium]|nr:prepilin peptidase [Oscillospiraceae bacterium]